ncbi:MAG: peptidoglycan DD-metalloendopeptidase family protein [Alphaproteobacteria bacterium]
MRRRYLFTKSDRLRLRYIVGTGIVSCAVMVSFLGAMGSSVAFAPTRIDVAKLTSDAHETSPSVEEQARHMQVVEPLVVARDGEVSAEIVALSDESVISGEVGDVVQGELAQESGTDIIKIDAGDTVAGALQNAGIGGVEAYYAVKAMSDHFDPRTVKPGQAISVDLEKDGDNVFLSAMRMKLSPVKEVVIEKNEQGRFSSSLIEKEIQLKLNAAKTSIETSLYGSAARAGIPASVVAEMIRIYSYEVDFQRDLRQGDTVEIFYETYETEDGEFARYGNIVYANLMVGGHEIPVYRYEHEDLVDYYRENGTSLKRTLMMTPVDGARISSGFGMRRHPVLGYNKMHKGVDFAAPRGTPVYAAGDGVLEKVGRNGGYGNYIRIRHNGELKTAYAHLKGFSKGMSSGKRVKQGQVIGYVGTTGRSTGPHLHFEVLRNGSQVNPKSIKSSPGQKLAGRKLEKFKGQISEIRQKYATLATDLKFAKNQASR